MTYGLEETRPLSHNPGIGMSARECISANCEGVFARVNSNRSCCISGSSILLLTLVGSLRDLGKVSYTLALKSWNDFVPVLGELEVSNLYEKFYLINFLQYSKHFLDMIKKLLFMQILIHFLYSNTAIMQ